MKTLKDLENITDDMKFIDAALQIPPIEIEHMLLNVRIAEVVCTRAKTEKDFDEFIKTCARDFERCVLMVKEKMEEPGYEPIGPMTPAQQL